MNLVLVIVGVLFLFLVVIFWYKVRTHSSFPLVLGLGLAGSAYFGIFKLFVEFINSSYNTHFEYQFSNMETIIFYVFIAIVLGIYYLSPTRLEQNIIKNTINKNGEILQEGKQNLIKEVDNTSGKIRQKSE